MSFCLILWKIVILPGSVSRPRCSASSSRARATRALTVRKLAAASSSSASSQTRSEGRDQIAIDFGIVADAAREGFTTDEAELAVPDRNHSGRARQPIYDRELTYDRARAEYI